MENNIKENAEKWNEVLEKLEEFMYGDNGIETVASVDYNLDTYILNTDLVISILTELKKLEKSFRKKLFGYIQVFCGMKSRIFRKLPI